MDGDEVRGEGWMGRGMEAEWGDWGRRVRDDRLTPEGV